MIFFIKSLLTWVQVYTAKSIGYTVITLSFVCTSLNSNTSGINILCIFRFAKNCTRENKDTTFDNKIAKFNTHENFRLYGKLQLFIPFISSFIISCYSE